MSRMPRENQNKLIPLGSSKQDTIMQLRISILLFFVVALGYTQEKKSKADIYFYQYDYASAIREYQKEMGKAVLTNDQYLNLADSYFQTGDYKNASRIYLDMNKKDTLMSNHRFNKMLQSLSKISDTERIKAFLNSKRQSLSNELIENAEFNFQLLGTNTGDKQEVKLVNVNSNSPQSDFSPTFYKDKLLFSSGRVQKSRKVYSPTGESYLDIYVARINPDGNIVNSDVFTGVPDSKYHKSTPYYASEKEVLYYILSNAQGDQLSFDKDGKNALAMGAVDYSGSFQYLLKDLSTSFYYPFFDEANGRLYFAANFKDGFGGTDLYYVVTNGGQIMSQPINLGPRINSPGNEISPYIFENSLYFSSDVFYGIGGMDVYKSNIQEGEQFSIPINLGGTINSTLDDFGFIIKSDVQKGYTGYFASNRSGGKGGDDIYGFSMNSLPGLKTLIIRGLVAKPNSTDGIENVTITILDPEKNVLKEVVTNADGNYNLEIPWRDNVLVEVRKEKYSSYSTSLDKNRIEQLLKDPLNIEMLFLDDAIVEKDNEPVLKLKDFYFMKGSSDITSEIETELNKVVGVIQKFPQIKLRIESHTDSRGSSTTNKKLSQKRADVIKGYLLKNGVKSENISATVGYGEDKIINSCKDGVYCLDFLHKQNERNLFVVINEDQLN